MMLNADKAMTIPETIPLAVPDLRGREADYLMQCVADNWVSSAGPFVSTLEAKLASLTGRKYAVATMNGTAALHLSLLGVGAGSGKLVLIPDWTFAATANATLHSGAQLGLVDVSPEDWGMDPRMLRRALETADLPVAAVMVVHPLGYACNIQSLLDTCEEFGVPLIEDAAGAIGASAYGRPVGSFGRMAAFSFNGNKVVTAGGGGMIVTDDDVALRLRSVSAQARQGLEYLHSEVGFNYRMTNLNAAVGLAQLERMDEMIARKHAIARAYDAAVATRDDMAMMPRPQWSQGNSWLYSVRCASQPDAASLVAHLNDRGIGARVFWRAMSVQPAYQKAHRYLRGISGQLSGTLVSLPCSSGLTEQQHNYVIGQLANWRGSVVKALTVNGD